ncbi:MAG: NUDIX domain-containing protein [Candidatus Obscuribacterales bacterium]|nr:NUDIX domain-containing protein [Candidatus Obscuribacterales bacterium]
MRERPSSRLIVLDGQNRVLLFKFVFKNSALAVEEFWATPGGALDAGETFEDAAKRELFEETGIKIDGVEQYIAERQFVLPLPDGEKVQAVERFFVVRLGSPVLSYENRTFEERQVMTNHRWWRFEDLKTTTETIFPGDIVDILETTKT